MVQTKPTIQSVRRGGEGGIPCRLRQFILFISMMDDFYRTPNHGLVNVKLGVVGEYLPYLFFSSKHADSRLAQGKVDLLPLVLQLLGLALVLVRPKELVLDVTALKRLSTRYVHACIREYWGDHDDEGWR